MLNNYWLLLEKSDETRVSKGIDGYLDHTGESYRYDSLVPNHKRIGGGDAVVLRKENEILGVGMVAKITEKDDVKIHRRCPACKCTDIRERTTKAPKWKCGQCPQEFSEPEETIVEIRAYEATIEGFARLNSPPSVKDVKMCATAGNGVSSQLSILQLDGARVTSLLEGTDLCPSPRDATQATRGQGFGLSQAERRAVELRAMHLAREIYEKEGWTVVDKSASHPFDLLGTQNQEHRFIEVKGTTGEGCSIILTHGEVQHVRNNTKNSALIIAAKIRLERTDSGWTASGGEICSHEDPWIIHEAGLTATQFKYQVL